MGLLTEMLTPEDVQTRSNWLMKAESNPFIEVPRITARSPWANRRFRPQT